jgi:hypothetical protein
MALPALVSLTIAAPVWFSADWFAARVFPAEAAVASAGLRSEPLFALGLALIGVFLLCEGIPVLASGLSLFLQSRQSGILGPDLERQQMIWHAGAKANTIAAACRVALGAACVAGPARLGALFGRVNRELQGTLVEDAPAGTDASGPGQGGEQAHAADGRREGHE